MAPAKRPATYADIEELPEHLIGEIIDGELLVSPRPRPRHSMTATAIASDLLGPFQRGRGGPGGWWILPEVELHLDRQVLVPDISGWRRERLPEIPDTVGIRVAPDWLCEVLSPSTTRIVRRKKLPLYATHGVDHLWLVDPIERLLEVYRRQELRWLLIGTYGDDDKIRVEPFEAIELDLAAWWLPPGAGAAEPTPVWEPTTIDAP